MKAKEIAERFRNLKTSFSREHKRTYSQKSGDGTDAVYVTKWKHYNKMLFLRDTISADESQSNLNSPQEINIDINCDEADYTITSLDVPSPTTSISSSHSSHRSKRKKNEQKSELYEMAAKVLCTPEEKDDIFQKKSLTYTNE